MLMHYRILVLDKGKRAELGSPRDLINERKVFYEMARDAGLATYFDGSPPNALDPATGWQGVPS